MLINTLKSQLVNFPFVTKDSLTPLLLGDDSLKSLQQEKTKLARLHSFSTLNKTEKKRFKEVTLSLENETLLKILIEVATATPTSVFQLVSTLSDEDVIDADKLTALWLSCFQAQLTHEDNALSVIKFISIDNSYQYAAFIVFLLQGVSQANNALEMLEELMTSGLLQQFFQYHVGMDLTLIEKTYQLIQGLSFKKAIPKEVLESFEGFFNNYSAGLRGFERYALNGRIDAKTLPSFAFSNPKKSYNKKKENLIALHTLFGVRFFIQLCIDSHRGFHADDEQAVIKKIIEAIQDKDLIELLLFLYREVDSRSRVTCLNEIVYHFSKKQQLLLFEAGFFWPVLYRREVSIDALDENTMTRYLSKKIHDADLDTAVIICARDNMTIHQTKIYQQVIKQLLLNPVLVENLSRTAITYLRNNRSINLYCLDEEIVRYKTLRVLVTSHINEGFSENAFIDICDLTKSQKSSIAVLQRLVPSQLSYPVSNYGLHAFILESAYQLDTDFDLCHYLSIFHSELQYSDYPEPKKEQEAGQLRTLYETLLRSDDDAVKDKIIKTIKKDFSKALWWQVNINNRPFLDQFLSGNRALVVKHLLPEGSNESLMDELFRLTGRTYLTREMGTVFESLLFYVDILEQVLETLPAGDRLSFVLQKGKEDLTLLQKALKEDAFDAFKVLMVSLPQKDRLQALKEPSGTNPLLHEINDLESLKIALSFFTPSEQQELVLEKTDKGESFLTKHLLVEGGLNFFEGVVGKATLVNCLELSGILLQSISNNDRNAFERGMLYLPEGDRERFMVQKMENSVFVETVIGTKNGLRWCVSYLSRENQKEILIHMLTSPEIKRHLALYVAQPGSLAICTEGQLNDFARVIKVVSELPLDEMLSVLSVSINEEQNLQETIIAMCRYSPLHAEIKSLFVRLLSIEKDMRVALLAPELRNGSDALCRFLLNIKADELIEPFVGLPALVHVMKDKVFAEALIINKRFNDIVVLLPSDEQGPVILELLECRQFIHKIFQNVELLESLIFRLDEKNRVPVLQSIAINYLLSCDEDIHPPMQTFFSVLKKLEPSKILSVAKYSDLSGNTLMHRLASLKTPLYFFEMMKCLPLAERHDLLHLENNSGEKVIDLVSTHLQYLNTLKTLLTEEDWESVRQKAKRFKETTEDEEVIAIRRKVDAVVSEYSGRQAGSNYSSQFFNPDHCVNEAVLKKFSAQLKQAESLIEIRGVIIDFLEERYSDSRFSHVLLNELLPTTVHSYDEQLLLIKEAWGVAAPTVPMESDVSLHLTRSSL